MTRQIRLFGSLAIEENGRSSPIMKYRKGRALLVYLIITRQAHSREMLADLLWDAPSTAQSFRNLRKLLHQIRPHAPNLQITQQELAYQPNDEVKIDLYTLEEALSRQDIDQLDKALALYTGDLLADFYLEDRPQFNEWLLLEREQLRQRVWAAYEQLCAAFDKQQQWQRGIEATRRWLRLDSLDEAIHRQLMQFLAADGQIEAALQQYENCRQELQKELGTEPDTATKALATRLRQLQWPKPDELPQPGALPPNSYLPYHRNPTFVGRASDLQQLAEHLLPSQGESSGLTKAAVITGMGGLGKTQLAVEYAYRYGRYYAGGVYWISFADSSNIMLEIANVGGERGMKLYQAGSRLSLNEQVNRVQSSWQERNPRLLIFDNCEDERLALAWLPVSGGCSVLLTSRKSGWPLEMPLAERSLAVLQRRESIALLLKLAKGRAQDRLASIATELGDHPLALQLAGHFLARHRHVTSDDYLTQLHNQRFLQHGSLRGQFSHYSPTGHELHVASTFAISLEMLDAKTAVDAIALRLLARAACFAPGEPINNALLYQTMPMAGDDLSADFLVVDALIRLLSLGLLEAKGAQILVMHRLLVLFTQQALSTHTNAQKDVEEQFIQQLLPIPQIQYAFLQNSVPIVHLHHLTDVALRRADLSSAQLALFLSGYFYENTKLTDAESYAQQAYTIRANQLNPHHPDIVFCQIQLGKIYWSAQKYELAERHLQEALVSFEQDDKLGQVMKAEALMVLGQVFHHTANYDEAQQHFEQALTLLQANNDAPHPNEARTLHELGTLFLNSNQYEKAKPYFERALTLHEKIVGRQHPETTRTVFNLAILTYRLGEQEKAYQLFQEVLTLSKEVFGMEHHITAAALNSLGVYHFGIANYGKASHFLEQAVAIRQKIFGMENAHTAISFSNMGLVAVKLGDFAAGQKYHRQAIVILEELLGLEHLWTCHVIDWYAESLIDMGEFTLAQESLDRILAILETEHGLEHPQTISVIYRLGHLHLQLGQLKTAESYLEQALALGQKILKYNHLDIAHTHHRLGELYQAKQNSSLAHEHLARALTIYKNKLPGEHPDIQRVQKSLEHYIAPAQI